MNKKIFGEITPTEFTFIIVFAIILIITLKFSLTVFILIILGVIYALIGYIHGKMKKEKIKKAISGLLIIFVPILFVIDTSLTYYSVFNKELAQESNPFVLFLWTNLGSIGGEFARFGVFLGLMTLLFFINKSQNEKRRTASSYLLLFMYFMWVLVVTSNIIQLFR
jgi:hypothetical protein